MTRLEKSFGVCANWSIWLQAYLHNRTQTVRTGQSLSSAIPLTSKVSIESVLGPILFSTYVSFICNIITNHSLRHQQYGDYLQLFISLSASHRSSSILQLEFCLYLKFTNGSVWMDCVWIQTNLKLSSSVIETTLTNLSWTPAHRCR